MHYTICDLLDEIVCNAVYSGADRISVELAEERGHISLMVADNGCGMSETERARAQDPLYSDGTKHPDRRAGLGIPFLAQAAELVGGSFSLESRPGVGTSVRAMLDAGHVDTPPVGDVPNAIRTALCYDGEYEMEIRRAHRGGEYRIIRSEIAEAVGELSDAQAQLLLLRYLREQEQEQELEE